MPRFENINVSTASLLLNRYKREGFGEQLFAAFLQWRDAKKEGARPGELDALGEELLPCLEEVIFELWKVTQELRANSKLSKGVLLTKLRTALHISKGQEPFVLLLEHRRSLHVELVKNKYEEMADTGVFKDETTIRREVHELLSAQPSSFGLPRATTPRTVGNHWAAYLKANPEEKARINLIIEIAKLSGLTTDPERPLRPAKTKKPATQPARVPKAKNTKKPASWR